MWKNQQKHVTDLVIYFYFHYTIVWLRETTLIDATKLLVKENVVN